MFIICLFTHTSCEVMCVNENEIENKKEREKKHQKKSQEKFNSVTNSVKPVNQNQEHNVRKEDIGQKNNFR